MSEKAYDLEEFKEFIVTVIAKVKGGALDQTGFVEHLPLLFERNRIYSSSPQEEKKIALESVLGIIFKHDIYPQ